MTWKFKVGSFWKYEDLLEAVDLITSGQPVGIFNRGACTIWGDSGSQLFLEALSQIKGQPESDIPLVGSVLSEHLVSLVDARRIAKRLRSVFTDARQLVHRFGSLAVLQLPVKETAVRDLPGSLFSRILDKGRFMNVWEPSGHRPAQLLVSELASLGVKLPVFSPMDSHDKAEINNHYEGIMFSEKHGIPLFLEDYQDTNRVHGPHTVIKVDGRGIHLVQEGSIPDDFFDVLAGETLDRSETMAAWPAQKPFPIYIPEHADPQTARLAILCYIQGWPADKISHLLLPSSS